MDILYSNFRWLKESVSVAKNFEQRLKKLHREEHQTLIAMVMKTRISHQKKRQGKNKKAGTIFWPCYFFILFIIIIWCRSVCIFYAKIKNC